MAQRPRRTLRDFDEEAIGHQAEAEPAPEARRNSAAVTAPPAKRTNTPRSSSAKAAAGGTTRTGLYFHPATFDAAKSAYLVDFDAVPGSPDSFARWVSAALAAHAALTPAHRAAVAEALPEEPRSGSGFTRSFELDDTTIKAMETAITEDRRAYRFLTRSQFGNEAVRAAIEAAKQRAGGVLPPAPARLPNRPVR